MKGSKLYSVVFNKCPRCQQGQFFKVNNPYNLSQFYKMNSDCSSCGESFIQEPGFYVGAMYVSYAISVALTALCFFGLVIGLGLSIYLVLGLLISLIVVLMPVSFRLSRLIWINMFVTFKKQ